jgi:multicomponent K+:H+ antiporter subunit F
MIPTAATLAIALLVGALACCVARLVVGPSFADRIVASDTLVLVVMNLVVTLGVLWQTRDYADVPVLLAALGFVGTVAAAQFIRRGGPLA